MGLISSALGYLLAKTEGTYGVDASPSASSDAFCLAAQPTITVDRQPIEEACRRATYGGHAHATIRNKVTFEFQFHVGGIELVDGGTPAIDVFLRASGHAVALSGTAAANNLVATYTPQSVGHASATIHYLMRDKDTGEFVRIKLLGCRGNLTFNWAMNGKLTCMFAGEALYAEWEPSASFTPPTEYGKGIEAFLNTGTELSWNSRSYDTNAFAFQTNWTIENVLSMTGDTNVSEVYLSRADTGGRPGGSFNPTAKAADFATSGSLKADMRAAVEAELSFKITTGPRSLELVSENAQLGIHSHEADGAHLRFNQPFFCNTDSGDDDYSLIFRQEAI